MKFQTLTLFFLEINFPGGVRKAVGFEIPVTFDASKTFDPDVLLPNEASATVKQDEIAG